MTHLSGVVATLVRSAGVGPGRLLSVHSVFSLELEQRLGDSSAWEVGFREFLEILPLLGDLVNHHLLLTL